jgi:uncharacterized membrane protein
MVTLPTVGQQGWRTRIVTVEERIAALEARTDALEARTAAPRPRTTTTPPRPATPPRAGSSPAGRPPVGSPLALEDALGGRLLAWVGGAAVALGVVFLLAIAVSRGCIGEVERTLLAGLFSGVLLAAGVHAHGRRGRTDASLAAAAAGIAGLFATTTVAGSLYHLIPIAVAVVAIGAVATALAVRWEALGIAGLGVLGALASPVLLGAVGAGAPVALLFVATGSAAAVLLWQRWRVLAIGAWLVALAVAHVGVGLAGRRTTRISPGQAAMSALWAFTGVAVLLAGLVRDLPLLRQARWRCSR